jgi:polyisoprenoid-binding protein YceI
MIRASILAIGFTVTLSACATTTPVTAPTPRSAASSDKIWFTGSSNIRRFTCRANQVNVSAEAAPEEFDRTNTDGLPAVRSAALQVPVKSLDCGIGLQNAHMFETLDASTYPSISFRLSDYTVERADGASNVRMQGLLRIAGTERGVVIHGSVFRNSAGELTLRGAREIDIRDFGIKPPRRFLGLLRVRNEVTVHFEVAVRPLIDPLGVLVSSLQ